MERGLDYTAIRKMTVGQIVDFNIEYNKRQEHDKKKKPEKHKATQNEINAFFGG